MSKITCYIKGNSVVFYRDADDNGFHSVRLDLCSTIPDVREQTALLARHSWASPALLEQFEKMVKQYHNLHLASC